jgi:hypothetical protein
MAVTGISLGLPGSGLWCGYARQAREGVVMATDDAASEIIRPRRRGESRPEPEPSVPAEVGAQAEAAEVEAEQPPAQLPVQPLAEPEPPACPAGPGRPAGG